MQMNIKWGWIYFAAMGAGAFVMGLYAVWKTLLYFDISGDTTGATIFGFVALCLLIVAGLHWYMAVGFKFGRLDSVTGVLATANLRQGSRVIMSEARIQFIRKLDTDNLNLTTDDRYVFFVCGYRPWLCKEAQFQVDSGCMPQ